MGRWGSRQKEMRLFLTLAITQDDVGSEFSRWLLYPEVPHCLKAKKKKKQTTKKKASALSKGKGDRQIFSNIDETALLWSFSFPFLSPGAILRME